MNLKTFSQQSRRILIKGVAQKLLYWGFDAKGNVLEQPMSLEGGYLFRGEGYDDPSVPQKWSALREAVQKKGIDTVVEEAAYTWFNRMMAIRILSKNKYDQSQLEFEGDSNTPTILVKARRGQMDFLKHQEKERLQKVITDYSKEKESFAILLTGYCGQHQLLKSIFGRLDDYTELLLPDDVLEKEGFIHLLNTTDAISEEDYQKVELIGWLYQFYISERKDEVFASFKKNKKAEAKDIPAATQIFTPNWIVKYMVQNTVGKLWLDLNPDSRIKESMKYLIADESQKQSPIITEASALKLLDPAVGSGHILVEGFDLVYAMYMEEFYTPEEAVESILQNNLFGLDIDNRAAQLAKFAVLLKAAKRYPDVLQKGWMPQIYAMPEPSHFSRQEILDFLGKDELEYEEELSDALKLMQNAQNLGSAMKIRLKDATTSFIKRRLKDLQNQHFQDLGMQSLLNKITSFISIGILLSQRYEAIAANPPYMGSGNMNADLKTYVNAHYPISKSDLFAVFMEVSLNLNVPNGLMGMINQHSWMFLSSYEKLREEIINKYGLLNMLHLGPRTFEELSGEVVQSTAFVFEKGKNIQKGNYVRLVDYKSNKEKEKAFLTYKGRYFHISQINFSKIPGSPTAYWVSERIISLFEKMEKIEDFGFTRKGMVTADNPRFIRKWYEVSNQKIAFGCYSRDEAILTNKKWYPYQKGGAYKKWFGNNDSVINFENDGFELLNMKGNGYKVGSTNHNLAFIFKEAIVWNKISSSKFSARYSEIGFLFDDACPFFSLNNEDIQIDIFQVLGFLNSVVALYLNHILNPTLNFSPGIIALIPFSSDPIVSDLAMNSINLAREVDNGYETSWYFRNSSILNKGKSLELAFQAWQEKMNVLFFQLHKNEEELNKIFIKLYGLEKELTPEVPFIDITIFQEEINEKKLQKLEDQRNVEENLTYIKLPIKRDVVMKQLISFAIGVNMGRYRLDKPGLNIAHPNPIAEELAAYTYNNFPVEIDEDAIIPLMGTACTFADDAFQRVRYFLEVVWGTDTLTQNLNFLQECLDEDLESYLVKKFWADHCKTYKKKPIYWLFSSEKGAFQVLTYMHRMNAFTVEKIRSNYLIPHLQHLRSQIDRLESNREDPRALDKLHKDLIECEAYDLKLKDVADRQIVFDLDDGVTRNYELFEGVVRKVK